MLRKNGNLARPALARRVRILAIVAAGCLAVTACGSGNGQASGQVLIGSTVPTEEESLQYGDSIEDLTETVDSGSADYPAGYEQLAWEDLVPIGFSHQEIFGRYEERLAALENGSPEANEIYAEMQAEINSPDAINDELDGTKINLAGFVAPLRYEGDIITEFLLVPYFGACIHVPAPPANQTILVALDKSEGLSIEDSWGAIWVAGTLKADTATTDLATASYTMTDATSGVYDEYG